MTSNRFSPQLVAAALLVVGAGLAAGGVEYSQRSHTLEHRASGASAWPVHLVLSCLALTGLVAAVSRSRRCGVPLRVLLTAPLRRRAAARLRAAAAGPRIVPAGALTVLIGYDLWRAAAQVIGGLDPNFTRNAWGGPTYVGAMYCHYLDLTLISAAAVVLLDRVVLPRPATGRRGDRARVGSTPPPSALRRRSGAGQQDHGPVEGGLGSEVAVPLVPDAGAQVGGQPGDTALGSGPVGEAPR